MAADVLPVLDDREAHHDLPLVQQAPDQVGHVEARAGRNEVPGAGLEQVDAGVHQEADARLLGQVGDSSVVALHDPERDLDLVGANAHRQRRGVLPVEAQHLLVGDPGQDVAVDHQERPGRPRDQPEAARRAHRLILGGITDADPECLAVAEVVDDGVGQVVGGEVDLTDPGLPQLVDRAFQHRPLAHRKHGLGDGLRQRQEAGAEAAGHDHGRQVPGHIDDEVLAEQEVDQDAGVVDDRQVVDVVLQHHLQRLGRCDRRARDDRLRGGDGAARVGQRHLAQDRAADVTVAEKSHDLPIRTAQDEAAGPGQVQLGDGVGDGALRRRDDGLEDLRALAVHGQDPGRAATTADGSLRTR